jgi:hypothetical protein
MHNRCICKIIVSDVLNIHALSYSENKIAVRSQICTLSE